MVGTPGRLTHLLSTGTLDLSACHTMVLDEADVLLGDAAAFAQQASRLCSRLVDISSLAQTLSVDVNALCSVCLGVGSALHAVSTHHLQACDACPVSPPSGA